MLRVLDAAALRDWCSASRSALARCRDEIDALNVYPVPDGDTGTNLLLTVESVEAAVLADGAATDVRTAARAMAHGALMGARGNSGVLLSQLLRGVSEALGEAPQADARALAAGLVRGAEQARAAVAEPVEGTLLTVAAAAGAAAQQAAVAGEGLGGVVRAARQAAETALAGTTAQLAALRDAGVVDAGGRGWVVVLRALEPVVTGEECADPVEPAPPRVRTALVAAREAGSPEYAYEVQYLLAGADEPAADRLRAVLGGLGDCVVVVGGGSASPGMFNVHVHVNDVGAALEAGVDAGRPSRITVTRFEDAAAPAARRAVVAVAAGEGLARLCAEAGATVVPGGRGARPSADDLLAAVRAAGAPAVALLPDDAAGAQAATEAAVAARDEGLDVRVVPVRSPVQGLAALAVADASRPFAEDVAAMTAAAGAVRTGEVVRAATSASTSAGLCLPGDALGVVDGAVVLVGADVSWVARGLVDRLLPGADLLTLVVGAQAPYGLGESLAARAREAAPGTEVVVVDGGETAHLLLVGAE